MAEEEPAPQAEIDRRHVLMNVEEVGGKIISQTLIVVSSRERNFQVEGEEMFLAWSFICNVFMHTISLSPHALCAPHNSLEDILF